MNPNQPQQQPTREQFIETLFDTKKKDSYLSGKEARSGLMEGIRKGVDSISGAYGSMGSNSVLEEDLRPYHKVTNDGKMILDAIRLADPVENMGLNILREVADKSDRESGDGRKTSVILAGAILEEGMKSKESAMKLKNSLMECLPVIISAIDRQVVEITPEEIGQVAAISSESEEVGRILQEIYEKIGKDGIIEIGNSNLTTTHYDITDGVRLRGCGFTYPYMANSDKGRKAVYENPFIIVTKQRISNIMDLDPVLKYATGQGKNEIVIFCDDIDVSVSQALAHLHMNGIEKNGAVLQLKSLVIKAPVIWKDYMFEDFAKCTGAVVIDPTQGTSLRNFQTKFVGTCDKISVSEDETVILGTKDLSEHIQVLQDEGSDDSKRRICWLQTKTAILSVGANSDTELFPLKAKISDARNASYLALNHGVVCGGGLALLNASKSLGESLGGKILRKALEAPMRQILENCDEDEAVMKEVGGKKGYDSKSGKVVDMAMMGIYDPAVVTKNAIRNALSVVATILTTKSVITKAR